MNRYLSVTQAADILGISRQRCNTLTLDQCPKCQGEGCNRCWHTGKRLPSVQVGGKKMILRADLVLVQDR